MKTALLFSAAMVAGPAMANTASIADLRYGQMVTITGVVQNITDEDEFRIKDASGAILVYIGPNIVPFDLGETVTVSGRVDREMGQLELYARDAMRGDGTKIRFEYNYD